MFKIRWHAKVPESEFSLEFVQGMANRMAMSYFKYGLVHDAPDEFDTVASIKKRLQLYEETGNTEHLMDAANFAMIEFMVPQHADAHFRATDSGESPGLIPAQEAIKEV